ncbi:hypothetical protein ACPPVO_12695 [Dactylosporangium sp. McL0621]|uniref:hypothetical protein n=1 Tax=Dactylosporangium sp. McL0621 TaxID=3415678 RepID=UPI003CF64680
MNRRSLLLAAGAVGVTTAVGGAAAAIAADDPEAGRGARPMFTWELAGGFVPAGWSALRAPRLVAYDDGVLRQLRDEQRARLRVPGIADAAKRLRIGPGELRSLRNHATTVLRDPANARRRAGAPIIADVPSTVFTARTNGRRFSLQFEGLEETRRDRADPTPAYSLLDHCTQLRDRVNRTGTAFAPDAVRMIAVLLDAAQPASAPVPPWPAGVPVPRFRKDEFLVQTDLRDRRARALMRAVPRPDSAQWPVFRLPDGRRAQLNWRFLLPHE